LAGNLWLCLQCGNVACGRKQFGGEGLPGNGHALAHYNETKHPVAVKLGSITAEGKADIFCYADDEEIVDPELQGHLKHWGINLAEVVQTEKSLVEMQLDLQYKYSFNMSSSTGEPLEPVFGQGLTGLQNLGNSCYMASIIQVTPPHRGELAHGSPCLVFQSGRRGTPWHSNNTLMSVLSHTRVKAKDPV